MRTAGKRCPHQRFAAPVIVAEHRVARQRRGRDAAIDLTAGGLLIIEENTTEPGLRGEARDGEPGRTGADDGDVIAFT